MSSRSYKTLGQIYDGQETWETSVELGDVVALTEPTIRPNVSKDAMKDAKDWIDKQEISHIELSDFWSKELEELFRNSDKVNDRAVALAVCLFKPAIRWCLEKYCEHLLASEKSLPTFCQRRYGSNAMRAIQDWGEERIFGGQLSLEDGKVIHDFAPPFGIQ